MPELQLTPQDIISQGRHGACSELFACNHYVAFVIGDPAFATTIIAVMYFVH
jgi:hypothetical protein